MEKDWEGARAADGTGGNKDSIAWLKGCVRWSHDLSDIRGRYSVSYLCERSNVQNIS